MRSAPDTDLTRRARIRDAALALFAERGYAGASVRAIAEAAGVSSALVAHHFGSKPDLRRACDEHVLAAVFDAKDELGAADPAATIQRWLHAARSETVLLNYLARMLVEGPEASGSLLERLVSQTEQGIAGGVAAGTIRAHENPRMLAVLVTLQGLLPLVMQRQLRGLLDGAPDLEAVTRRITIPLLELYTYGLYTDSHLLDAARATAGDEGADR
ncbi:TetR family transcriptional regulator [Ruania zhangjianzhongii]|uniref:TetR family transcriptional regulator n=1 Tax=Ruania zhangjianzhongii TaxID=2603206 RepID=UPI00143DA372|nr:TetR family transcriptional regulator [Ruania zhangjianzhongii]